MTVARCCTCTGVLLLVFIVGFVLALFFLPCMPPYVHFPEYKGPAPEPLKTNGLLNRVERMGEGQLRGPAALAMRDGQLYTGLLGGSVVRVDPDNMLDIVNVTRLGNPDCVTELEGERCGRPLGMQFHTDGKLYLIDAYHGLYRVDVDSGKWEHLAGGNQYIGGQRVKLACDLAVARDGRVFWSDASTEIGPEDLVLELLAGATGRLLRYDPKKNRTETLIGRVNCPTGVTLSPDERLVYVAEAGRDRILRYHLVGAKSGTWDVFAEGLPGVPAKIKPRNPEIDDGLVVTLALRHPSVLLWLRRHPSLGRAIMRLSAIAENIFNAINNLVENEISRDVVYMLGNPQLIAPLLHGGAVIILNREGKIMNSLSANDGSLGIISQMETVDNYIYLASPYNSYLGRLNLTNELRQHFYGMNETNLESIVEMTTDTPTIEYSTTTMSTKSSMLETSTVILKEERNEVEQTTTTMSQEDNKTIVFDQLDIPSKEDEEEDTTLSNQVDEFTEEDMNTRNNFRKQVINVK